MCAAVLFLVLVFADKQLDTLTALEALPQNTLPLQRATLALRSGVGEGGPGCGGRCAGVLAMQDAGACEC